MTAYQYSQTRNTNTERMLIVMIDAAKLTLSKMGIDFETLPLETRERIITEMLDRMGPL